MKAFLALLLIALAGLSLAEETDNLPDHHHNPCHDKWWGEKVPHSSNCAKYYECHLTIPFPRHCSEHKVFDPSEKKCVPGNQETCEIYSHTTTHHPPTHPHTTTHHHTTTHPQTTTHHHTTTHPHTTTHAHTTTHHPPTHPPTTTHHHTTHTPHPPPVDLDAICHGVFFAPRPYPNNHQYYVGCIRGRGVLFRCFDGEHFEHGECTNWETSPYNLITNIEDYLVKE